MKKIINFLLFGSLIITCSSLYAHTSISPCHGTVFVNVKNETGEPLRVDTVANLKGNLKQGSTLKPGEITSWQVLPYQKGLTDFYTELALDSVCGHNDHYFSITLVEGTTLSKTDGLVCDGTCNEKIFSKDAYDTVAKTIKDSEVHYYFTLKHNPGKLR